MISSVLMPFLWLFWVWKWFVGDSSFWSVHRTLVGHICLCCKYEIYNMIGKRGDRIFFSEVKVTKKSYMGQKFDSNEWGKKTMSKRHFCCWFCVWPSFSFKHEYGSLIMHSSKLNEKFSCIRMFMGKKVKFLRVIWCNVSAIYSRTFVRIMKVYK